ncbi:MAG TPA: HPF/RaiA family ribosome-associated protein [Alphaproteobacteria bacterium]|nr:HPF/RaiA family ribosome-associated protein [Alphaproteobacteria bacterium]
MEVPAHIVIDPSVNNPTVRTIIDQEIQKLEQFHGRIISCRVAITAPQKRHHSGGLFEVRINIHVPRHREIVVAHLAGDKPEQEHIGVAVREAFAKARRQIQDASRIVQGATKTHEAPQHGRVMKLFPQEGHGFIETPDGLEIYFHRNSVVDGKFADLEKGVEVRFSAAEGEKGPQATTVHVVGKHHIA